MTRRRLYFGFAMGTLFLPACSALTPPTASMPLTPPGWMPQRQTAFVPVQPPAPPEEMFAAGRTEPTPVGVARNIAKPLPGEMAPEPAPEVANVQHRVIAEEPPVITSPRLHAPVAATPPTPEPVLDAEGVVRPHWPVIRGPLPLTDAPPVIPQELPRKIIQPEAMSAFPATSRREPPATINPPTPPSESIIGSSVHQTQSSPVIDTPPPLETIVPASAVEKPSPFVPLPNHIRGPAPIIAPVQVREEIPAATPVLQLPAAPVMLPPPSDTPLIQAVRAFQQNKPQEALEYLKAYDPATQQVLVSMMPALVQLSEGKLQSMKREEMDALLEQLTRVPPLLRPRASLQANKILLCRQVHKFGVVDPFPAGNEFRPGDMVYLYTELSNFSCVGEPQGGFSVALASHLELLDGLSAAVWKADPREEPERVSTPPQDYYRAYRFCVPSSLPPGKYALSIRITDKPTGRETTKSVEFRVGAK